MAVFTPSLVLSSRSARPRLVADVAPYGNGNAHARACARLVTRVQVRQTAGRAASRGELVLSFSSPRAIEEDCQVIIRAAESLGLHKGAAQ
ncbi:hypothetical protein ACFYWN_40975 [Streptomyces sp. NPDC002917]|uniref:hypothetical protein n=1 Tax=Streptomyces sp. NPDC002917 TaxID=3364671 RepID=UPI0036989909